MRSGNLICLTARSRSVILLMKLYLWHTILTEKRREDMNQIQEIGESIKNEPGRRDSRKLNIIYGCVQSFFMCAMCSYFAFLVLYLNAQGYTEFQIGLIMTMVSVVSIVSPSIYGYLADYVIPVKKIVIVMMLASIPIAFLLHLTIAVFPLALISVIGMGIAERSIMNVIDSWGVKIRSSKPYLNYGLTRGLASLSFAVAALMLGRFYELAGLDKLFWVHAFFAFLCVVSAALLDPVPTARRKKDSHSYLQTIRILLRNRKYLVLLIAMVLHGLSMVLIHTFQPILLSELGGTSTHLGLALFIMAASEAPVMFKSSAFIEKYRIESILIFVYFVTIIRVLSVVLAPSIGWFIGVQVLQAVSYGLYLPAILFYIILITSEEMHATAITMALSIGFGLAGILGNTFGGLLAQRFSVQIVYYLFAFMSFCAFLIFTISHLADPDRHKRQ